MKLEFNIQDYVRRSQALDLSDIDWEETSRYAVSPEEIRCLMYMMDIETHTIVYLRDLLNTRAIEDPELSDFLSCWLYEESYHGRAIARFLQAAGIEVKPDRLVEARRHVQLRERLEGLMIYLGARLYPDFVTVYMTWGAISELSTLTGYNSLAKRSANPVLAEILRRIVRDESRHFAFYYYKAANGLASETAQRATSWLLRKFWSPVGQSVKPIEDVDFMLQALFAGNDGRDAIRRVDCTIARLPGMSWFNLLEHRLDAAMCSAKSSISKPHLALKTS